MISESQKLIYLGEYKIDYLGSFTSQYLFVLDEYPKKLKYPFEHDKHG